ncbi:hypothetical protein L211DRAFT_867995 [Terfezia boudieri ATCC MYA-4762]|uniref:CFEM domain-containing protein n=1 Tax=Terfezia boudieri ATCC MYA-4762 TaxID=1051890 RepID=A0A3N4LRC8_9PEZI|nr:hypothetical protein L211DRAFT_867995 [Terfezia boudieri ATCC MYA-4762]
MRYALALLFLLAVSTHADVGPATCFQDCANVNAKGTFTCVGLDVPCYCTLDNGHFLPRFAECLQSTCPEVYSIGSSWLNTNLCPPPRTDEPITIPVPTLIVPTPVVPNIIVPTPIVSTVTVPTPDVPAIITVETTTFTSVETGTITITTTTTSPVTETSTITEILIPTTTNTILEFTAFNTTITSSISGFNATSTTYLLTTGTTTAMNDGNTMGANKWTLALALCFAGVFIL